MSEPCEKCGADISHQGEYHTNCEEVLQLRARIDQLMAEREALLDALYPHED